MNMNWFLTRCHRHRQNLSLLAAGALPEPDKVVIERHLADCPACRSHYQQILHVTASIADFRRSVAGVEPTPAARQHWARAIKAAGRVGNPGEAEPSRGTWWHELCWSCRYAWGGFTALWIAMLIINWEERPSVYNAAPATAITQTFAEERRLLAELIMPAPAEPAEKPRSKPGPRSEADRPFVTV